MRDSLTERQWLGELARPERGRLHLATLLGLLAGLLTLAQLATLASIVDRLVEGEPPAALTSLFLVLPLLLVMRALCQWGRDFQGIRAATLIRHRARCQLLDHTRQLGPARLADENTAGLASEWIEQVDALEGYFARYLVQQRLALLLPLLYIAAVFRFDWLAAALLLFALPLIPAFMALVGMGAERLNQDQFLAVARLAGLFIDRVRGLTTLQLFNRTDQALAEVREAADRYRRRSMKVLRLAFVSSAVLEFFASISIALLAIYVGFSLLGAIDWGPGAGLGLFSGLLILLLAPEVFQPLRTLAQHYHDRARALGTASRLVEWLNHPLPAHGPPECAPPAAGRVAELQGLVAGHPGRESLWGPLDFAINQGETLLVTGASGAGKTTLLHLLAGFTQPRAGRLRISRPSTLGWVDQRPLILQGTLADNLRWVAPQATDPDLWQALERADLTEVVRRMPQGLETPLGERGFGLSGGQAQRLVLARLFLARSPLVLLDEPTASLDEAAEQRVLAALRRLREGGATLVIAGHRPALREMADRCLELPSGKLREMHP